MTDAPVPRRRDQRRAETWRELLGTAEERLDADGVEGVTLSALARVMGVSGPALYRYVDSREHLLRLLATAGHEQLAATLAAALADARRRRPSARLRAVGDAYLAWARAHPHRYRLLFGDASGELGADDPDVARAAHASMLVLAEAVDGLEGQPTGAPALRRQVEAWAAARPGTPPPAALLVALRSWVRLHGVTSLELAGCLPAMGVGAELLLSDVLG